MSAIEQHCSGRGGSLPNCFPPLASCASRWSAEGESILHQDPHRQHYPHHHKTPSPSPSPSEIPPSYPPGSEVSPHPWPDQHTFSEPTDGPHDHPQVSCWPWIWHQTSCCPWDWLKCEVRNICIKHIMRSQVHQDFQTRTLWPLPGVLLFAGQTL